jgi:hypothetical protein
MLVIAKESIYDTLEFVTVDSIDTKSKTITVEGVKYNYLIKGMDDSYFVNDTTHKDLKYLLVGVKYYVNIHHEFTGKTTESVVDYIGKVLPPF